MDKWQRRNEALTVQGREEKLKKAKEKEKRIRVAREKVENMTPQEKRNRELNILKKVKAQRDRAAAERKGDEERKKVEKDQRLREASEKLSKWQKPSNTSKSPKIMGE